MPGSLPTRQQPGRKQRRAHARRGDGRTVSHGKIDQRRYGSTPHVGERDCAGTGLTQRSDAQLDELARIGSRIDELA